MLSAIQKRRSIRHYQNKPVAEEKIQEILKAGLTAPSANHRYPWEFMVVENTATKKQLAEATPWASFAAEASFIIAVLGDESSSEWLEDGGIAAENMVIEGVNQGLGSCYIQIRGHQNNQGEDSENYVRQTLEIPLSKRVLFLLPFGYPAETKLSYEEAELRKRRPVHREKYSA